MKKVIKSFVCYTVLDVLPVCLYLATFDVLWSRVIFYKSSSFHFGIDISHIHFYIRRHQQSSLPHLVVVLPDPLRRMRVRRNSAETQHGRIHFTNIYIPDDIENISSTFRPSHLHPRLFSVFLYLCFLVTSTLSSFTGLT